MNYPYLPKGREILYVSGDNEFMKLAQKTAQEMSTDVLHSTGAVIVKDGVVIAKAANISALGRFDILKKWHKKGLCLRKIFKVKTGEKYWLCPGCAGPRNHAEQQAIMKAKSASNDVRGADLYLWGHWWCCESCWNKMIDAGISNVYLLDESQKLFSK